MKLFEVVTLFRKYEKQCWGFHWAPDHHDVHAVYSDAEIVEKLKSQQNAENLSYYLKQANINYEKVLTSQNMASVAHPS